jgi:hypothetical protein
VGSGHRVDSFARVTLDGLSKNHAMTLIYPATRRRTSPADTPPWWTQPLVGKALGEFSGAVFTPHLHLEV